MYITDCHTHTSVSPDGRGSVEELCRQAEVLGLKALAVTEHCELNRFFGCDYYGETPRNEFEVYHDGNIFDRAMEVLSKEKKNPHSFVLVAGIELGQANADFSLADIAVRDKRLDFVIASLHELKGELDFAFLDYDSLDCHSLLKRYFSELCDIANWQGYDVLGHITYPLRYMVGEQGKTVDIKDYLPEIKEIFAAVIRQGKGIEINSSGLRQKYGRCFPDLELLEVYKKMGGRIVTIGSDAHCAADLAKGTDEAIKILKSAGFDKTAYFIKHEPVFIEL